MKRIIQKISWALLILIILIGIALYYYISVFFLQGINTSLKEDIKELQTSIKEVKTQEINYSADDLELFKLKEEYNKLLTPESTDEALISFLTEYDNAMDYDVDTINVFSEKQNYIKEQLEGFFSEAAFKNTEDYIYTQMPESYTTPIKNASGVVKGEYAEGKNKIPWQHREIRRSYICEQDADKKIGIILMIENYNKSNWEFQKISIESKDNKYIITDFSILNIY